MPRNCWSRCYPTGRAREGNLGHRTVTLYHITPSFYSQVARLGLAEKGVSYTEKLVAPGPPTYETYQPWYMRLNPMGTVPTLVVDGESLDDSRRILNFIDAKFDGPALIPSDPEQRRAVEHWVEEAYRIPERVLAYGSGPFKRLGEKTNHGRRRALVKWRAKAPDMASVYDHKIADIDTFLNDTADEAGVAAAWKGVEQALDRLDAALAETPFCAGEDYSLADVLWTVTVARQHMLQVDPFEGRPALQAWFERMKQRPSFRRADVWERFKPEVMLPILLVKLRWHVLGVVAAGGLLTWLTYRLLVG